MKFSMAHKIQWIEFSILQLTCRLLNKYYAIFKLIFSNYGHFSLTIIFFRAFKTRLMGNWTIFSSRNCFKEVSWFLFPTNLFFSEKFQKPQVISDVSVYWPSKISWISHEMCVQSLLLCKCENIAKCHI